MQWNSPSIRRLVDSALKEDAAFNDITTRTLISAGLKIEAQIQSKDNGVVCGLPLAGAFFKRLDPRIIFAAKVKEGQLVKSGVIMAVIRGKARAILSGERSALNAVQHLSGIATFTRKQVLQLASKTTAIYDTRKTIPGWRELQKYAVHCGGGKNHRMSLSESVLIKDNHLQICRSLNTNWKEAIQRLRRRHPSLAVEMEVQTNQDFDEAVRLQPDQVLLDNMSLSKLKAHVKKVRQLIRKAEIEVSGGVRTEHIRALSRLGVDRISMGRLTHSAPAFDCALEVTRVFNAR